MRELAWPVLLLAVLRVVSRGGEAAPEVTYLFPGGGQRGQTVTVTAGGSFPNWPVGVWTSDAEVSVTALDEKGKLKIQIGAAANRELVWLRVYDQHGAALPRPWIIGDATEFEEEEPNDTASNAQQVPHQDQPRRTVTVNGRLQKSGDVDVFSLSAVAGHILVADLDAHAELAAPFDGVLQILRPSGFVVAHNDDHHELDARLATELTRDGRWMVRVFGFPAKPNQNVQLAGNEDYVYRLTLSTGPVVNYAVPMAARRAQPNRWRLVGWNLTTELQEISLTPAGDDPELLLQHDQLGRTIRVPVVDCPILVEAEPNSAANPLEVNLPASVTGRLDTSGDKDAYQFNTVKGEILLIQVDSRKLGHPLDPVLELLDHSDQRVARVDDVGDQRDARITHKVQVEGQLRLVVSDLHGRGGLDFVYRLSLQRARPSFRVSSQSHQLVVKPGETTEVMLTVERTHGFSDAIEISVEGLPDGVAAAPATSQVGEDSEADNQVGISVAAAQDAPAASVPIRIVGRTESAGTSAAHFAVPGHREALTNLWLTVTAPE